MATYRFTLEHFSVITTRARGDDTDSVAFAAAVAGSRSPAQSLHVGDVDNGDVSVNLSSDPLFVASGTTRVVMSYAIYNGDASHLGMGLDSLVGKTIDEYLKQILEGGASQDPGVQIPDDPSTPNNATFDDTSWLNVLELAAIGSFLSPDCDGMVAADVIGRSKEELDAAIDLADGISYRQTRRYPGSDSPAGCGANSDYTVTWSVVRDRDVGPGPYSLGQFLQRNNLHPNPGLRSLFPGQPLTVRDLMT
jgi:hypothetical protein